MSKRILGFAILVLVGLVAIAGFKIVRPLFQERREQQMSDARATRGKLTIAMDNWIGYFPLCSPEMKNRMRVEGYLYECVDDGADYGKRMARLKAKEIQIAVATVDSYILNAAREGYPAVMSVVIDESKGGDSILALESAASNINAIKGRNGLRVAYTPNSPSHHLLKATADHFDVPELLPKKGPQRIETDGSTKALEKILAKQTDIAVLWEPDVSRALAQKGVVKILGTESTRQLIVDVLLVNRDYGAANADVVKILLANYFKALKVYRDHPERLEQEVMAHTKLSRESVRTMLKGVAWTTLSENCEQWFGIGTSNRWLMETIESAVAILMNPRIGDFNKNPLPGGDPNRIVWGRFIEELCAQGPTGFTVAGSGAPAPPSLNMPFPPLDQAGWNALKVIGSLKIEPITFRSSTADLPIEGKAELDKIAEKVKHYPGFRILVKGHTVLGGDPAANLELSQDRAESVARYFMVTYSMDQNRIRAIGVGSQEPLSRLPDESDGAYEFRLRRVEIALLKDVY